MKIHKIRGYINSIFIAEYGESLLLMDGGSPADVELIEDFCKNTLKKNVKDIKLSAVSHMHPDHSGAAPILRKKYGIPIAAFYNIDKWYSGPSGWLQHKFDCFMAQIVAWRGKTKIRKVFSQRITRPDFLMKDGETLPFFPDWTVIHTPGHTSHDIALFHEKEKLLYCGDSIINVKNKFYLPLPVIFKNKMRNSYRKLGSLDVKTILLPHGNNIETNNCKEIFAYMESLLDEPPNRLRKRVHVFSVWSPDIWKPTIKKFLFT